MPSNEWIDTRQALIGQEYESGLLENIRVSYASKLLNRLIMKKSCRVALCKVTAYKPFVFLVDILGSVMRDRITDAMKQALKAKDQVALGTMRLIMAALKDRDIAARGNGNQDGISDDDILSMLQTMIKQRNESAKMYRDGDRIELAEAEEAEIKIIQSFLPAQLDDAAMNKAIKATIAETGASSVKDMGQVMASLKTNFAGQMDFSAVSQMVKSILMDK